MPAVLVRVLGRKCDDLTFQDAILPVCIPLTSQVRGLTGQGYTRHCVKGEDYPAIIDRNETDSILPPDALVESSDTMHL